MGLRVVCLALTVSGCQGLFALNTPSSTGSGPSEGDGSTGSSAVPDVGNVALRRLNRSEYDNTVRDLLGTEQTLGAATFPPDDLVAGYDTIANGLTVSPLLVELYETAARSLASEAVFGAPPFPSSQRFEAEGTEVVVEDAALEGDAMTLFLQGTVSATFDVPIGGTYAVSTRVWCSLVDDEPARMGLSMDGTLLREIEVEEEISSAAEVHSLEVTLDAGSHTFEVSFLNFTQGGSNRNLFVDWLDVYGPVDVAIQPGDNPIRDALVTCDPSAVGDDVCAAEVLHTFASRAYRRPLTTTETERLDLLVELVLGDEGTFDDTIYEGLVAVLTSPHFLYRVEIDPDPTDPTPHVLTDHEIATRLSYFLWSTMPDDELRLAADETRLHTADQVTEQVERMLADLRAAALVDNFGGQWLFFRAVGSAVKDPIAYPAFDAELAASMQEEMRLFFETFVQDDRDMHELLTATTGEIDEQLAAHYGATDYTGPGWQSVNLAALDRGGVLGQAGVLTVESYPSRTSPTLRGKYVLGQLLCDEPPPPPPDVEALDETATADTVREQLEQHRTDPVCASCHEVMDEIGFGLEHFDAIGAWRDEDNGFLIDALGVLPDGTSFDGGREMSAVIAVDERLPGCVSEQLLTYGLGRLPLDSDAAYLDTIETVFAGSGFTFASAAVAVATSDPFLQRRGGEQ
jgi:hypothetical protein